MHTPSPAAGTTPPPRRRWFTWPRMLHAAPVAAAAVYGAWWIALHAGGGRASAHTLWQSLALTEALLALLLRHREPASALAAYLLFALDRLLLPAVLVALFTVAATRHGTTLALAATATAAAIAAMPYFHGDPASLPGYLLPRLAAAATAAAGAWLHARRETAAARARPGRHAGEPEPRGAPARPGPAGRSR